jgi:hypothetical protein
MSIYGRNVREQHVEEASNGTQQVDVVHLQHDHFLTGGSHTLCGIVDMPSWMSETDDPVTCEECLGVLEHCLRIAYVRGVIRSMPRASTIERARVSVDADDEDEDPNDE